MLRVCRSVNPVRDARWLAVMVLLQTVRMNAQSPRNAIVPSNACANSR